MGLRGGATASPKAGIHRPPTGVGSGSMVGQLIQAARQPVFSGTLNRDHVAKRQHEMKGAFKIAARDEPVSGSWRCLPKFDDAPEWLLT